MPTNRLGLQMRTTSTLTGLLTAGAAFPVLAQDDLKIIGKPVDGKVGFQPAATGLMENLRYLDYGILVVITLITVFVVALLGYTIVRFNRKSNPTPASFTHNTRLEVTWTVVPVFILLGIAVFSLPELFRQQ